MRQTHVLRRQACEARTVFQHPCVCHPDSVCLIERLPRALVRFQAPAGLVLNVAQVVDPVMVWMREVAFGDATYAPAYAADLFDATAAYQSHPPTLVMLTRLVSTWFAQGTAMATLVQAERLDERTTGPGAMTRPMH